MRYEFPKIEHLDDVRPAIEGRDEFIIAERDWGYVVNYMVNMVDTFPPVEGELDAIRRECRGMLFYPDGRIMARRLHKFFNVNAITAPDSQHIIYGGDATAKGDVGTNDGFDLRLYGFRSFVVLQIFQQLKIALRLLRFLFALPMIAAVVYATGGRLGRPSRMNEKTASLCLRNKRRDLLRHGFKNRLAARQC